MCAPVSLLMATRPQQQLQLKFLKQSMELLGTRLLYLGEMATDLSTYTHTQKMKIPWPSYKDLFVFSLCFNNTLSLISRPTSDFPFFFILYLQAPSCTRLYLTLQSPPRPMHPINTHIADSSRFILSIWTCVHHPCKVTVSLTGHHTARIFYRLSLCPAIWSAALCGIYAAA